MPLNEYRQLEYLTNNNANTYIDTGINGDSNKKIELKINITSPMPSGFSQFMGAWNGSCIMR